MNVYRRMIGALVCSINMARDIVWIHWHHKGGQQMLWFSIFVCFWISLYTSSQFFKPSVHLLLNSLLFSLLLHICMFEGYKVHHHLVVDFVPLISVAASLCLLIKIWFWTFTRPWFPAFHSFPAPTIKLGDKLWNISNSFSLCIG